MTSAPRSPSIMVQSGPARTRVRSRTRIPLSIVLRYGGSIVTAITGEMELNGRMPRHADACLRGSTRHLYFRHDGRALAREDSAAYQHSKSASIGRSSPPSREFRLSHGG